MVALGPRLLPLLELARRLFGSLQSPQSLYKGETLWDPKSIVVNPVRSGLLPSEGAACQQLGWSAVALMPRQIWRLIVSGILLGVLLFWPMGQALLATGLEAGAPLAALPARAEGAQKRPELVKVGIFITRLDNFNLNKKSFDASFWLWSVTPKEQSSRLASVEFVNAEAIRSSNSHVEETPAGLWSTRKVVGTFHHNWDLRHFPFDHQDLRLEIEESNAYIDELVYVPDQARGLVDDNLKLTGWRIVSSQVKAGSKTYPSSFGDPMLPVGGPTAFSRMDVIVRLERTSMTAFWKFTAGAFVAAVIALASYAFHVDQGQTMSPRFALLAGAVFAAIISLRTESSELGTTEYNTLVDQVHLVVLLYVLVATLTGVYTWSRYRKHGDCKAIQSLGRRMALGSTVAMVIVILGLVRSAAMA